MTFSPLFRFRRSAMAFALLLGGAAWAAEADFLSGTRQLTFEGRRSGEGYFNADGSKMVFQSEREPGNPFYQIYLLDLETGDTRRISPGTGKTTCAWIHPDGKRILFASTHLDPESKALQEAEYEERATSRVRKYSWDYDEHFDMFEFDLETEQLTNLTETRGYDAEGAYSPDGELMVFASNRQAYERELTQAEQQRMEVDKQFFMEIYTAKSDGSEVKRLTDVDGYDGGPFFSADGSRICWRRFTPKGDQAEVWSMAVDGSDQRQLTRLGAMSWAPYFHPSGEYLIFTTNLQGFANFELYLVDAKGEKEPVRVTETDGFDGLPVFSPDGTQLSWTSGRGAGGQSQIYLADWNHEAAMRALSSGAEATVAETGKAAEEEGESTPKSPDLERTEPAIVEEDLRLHLEYLASEELEGRLTGTRGERLATEYFAKALAHSGLLPYGEEEWYQPFDFTAGVALGKDNELTVTGIDGGPWEVGKDWRPLSLSRLGSIEPSEVVFAGYGIETPDEATGADGQPIEIYSSYAHLDVTDKWVMVFRYLPEGVSKERRTELIRYASLRFKALTARQKGARGLIVVSGPNSKVTNQLVPLAYDASMATSGVAAISVTDDLADRILNPTGKTLQELQDKLDGGELMGGLMADGVRLAAEIDIEQERKVGRNVLGVLPARSQPDFHTPPLIIGAHIDHLGTKGGSSSRAAEADKNRIHYGADDNASGTAAVLEIAQWMAAAKESGELKLSRDVIFAGWSGEELGLLGTNHFVESLAKMIRGDGDAKLNGMIAAYINMDMIGRFEKTLVLQGVGSSPVWKTEIERRNVPIGLPITLQNDAHLPTDSTPFYLKGIPVLNAFTGAHEDYHSPADTADKIVYDKTEDITRLIGLIARSIATEPAIPEYVALEAPKNQGTRTGLRAYLGTIPDYAQGDVKGVKLSGVSPTGPAAKAGVEGGDIVVELSGQDIQNIYDYTYIMGDLKIGEETSISVERGGERVTLKIVPQSRD